MEHKIVVLENTISHYSLELINSGTVIIVPSVSNVGFTYLEKPRV